MTRIRRDQNRGESWLAKSLKTQRFTIGDLPMVPTFNKKGEIHDLLRFYSREVISHSDDLVSLINAKWIKLTKKRKDKAIKVVDISETREAITPAEEDEIGAEDHIHNQYLENVVEDLTPELGGDLDALTHHIGFTQQTITSTAGTITIDWSNGNKAAITLTENITTINISDPPKPSNLMFKIVQGAGGPYTVAGWPSEVKWVGGTVPTITASVGAIDIIAFYFDSNDYFGVPSQNFS